MLFDGFVAVVDSGVGGLTILNNLQTEFPRCDFLYLADSSHCPYGTKTATEIKSRLRVIVEWLTLQRVSAVVLACNTASVFAEDLRREFDMPFYDVIVPTCKLVAATTVTKRVALLATDFTVASKIYSKRLAQFGIETVSFACSSLVPFVENNAVKTSECDFALQKALRDLPNVNADTVILGCTHFPILKNKIMQYTGKAQIVQCVTDYSPKKELRRFGKTIFFTTGDVAATEKASKFFPEAHFAHLNI